MFDQTISLLRDLVSFDTTSRNSNLPLIDYAADHFAKHGIDTVRIYNDDRKAHLLAQIGPAQAKGGLLFCGHTDTVPADGQVWDTNPWKLTQQGNKYIGRGTTDMKAFNALVMAQAQKWTQTKLKKPIYILLTYDEEVSSQAIIPALTYLKKEGIDPSLCIVGEPTQQQVMYAHNSRADITITSTGTGGHASTANDPGVTSAHDLARDFDFMLAYFCKNDVQTRLGDVETIGPASLVTTAWHIPETTNVIPSNASFHMDFRGKPGITAAELHQTLDFYAAMTCKSYQQSRQGPATLTVDVKLGNVGFHCQDENALKLAQQLSGGTRVVGKFVCDAAQFIAQGFPQTVVCGPGSISQAHKPNEFIREEDIMRYLGLLKKATRYVARSPSAQLTP